MRRAGRVQGWSIRRSGTCTPLLATQFALTNGALGVRGSVEERPDNSAVCFMARAYEYHPITYHEGFAGFAQVSETRIPVPDGTAIRILVANTDLATLAPESEEWELDLAVGIVRRATLYRLPDERIVEVSAERFVSGHRDAQLSIHIGIAISEGEAAIQFASTIETDVETVTVDDDPRIGTSGGIRMQTVSRTADHVRSRTRRSGLVVDVRQRHAFDPSRLTATDEGGVLWLRGQVTAGADIRLDKTVDWAIYPEAEAPPLDALPTQRPLDRLAGKAAHEAAMATLWDFAEIALPGQPRLEAALRFNLFHILQNAPCDNLSGFAAKGLTGEGYEGHIFWDAETFVIPVLALVAPDRARNHLAWRLSTLPAARDHARELNHRTGALFAWRTIAGKEGSAYFPSGSAQYHINAAVAYALDCYEQATGDLSLRDEDAAETVFETARIWIEAGRFNDDGGFAIHAITGPDEYHAIVDADYYTDRMAGRHLRYAVRLAGDVGGVDAAEVAIWARAAAAIARPAEGAVTPQDRTLLGKLEWDFIAEPIGEKPLLLSYHPLTLYRRQVLKQASVLLAHMLDGGDVPLAAKTRDYDYYEPRTVHDSTLSPCTHAVIAAEIGMLEDALGFFEETARVDLDDLHGNTHHGAHMAAMAGSWLALIWGFAGFRPGEGDTPPSLAPVLPESWESYAFTISWRGVRLGVDVSGEGMRLTVPEGGSLDLLVEGEARTVSGGAPVMLPLKPRPAPPLIHEKPCGAYEAAIFDLDGVLTDSAEEHFLAWERLAAELGIPIDRAFNERLKGVDRMGSLALILEHGGLDLPPEERQALAARKNGYYADAIASYGPYRLLPGARRTLVAARRMGLKTGVASSSRNAPFLIERLGIGDLLDTIVHGGEVAQGKPAPDLFLEAARRLGVEPSNAVGIEDAAAGVLSIKAAGMRAIGIGHAADLPGADVVVPSIARLRLERYLPVWSA